MEQNMVGIEYPEKFHKLIQEARAEIAKNRKEEEYARSHSQEG